MLSWIATTKVHKREANHNARNAIVVASTGWIATTKVHKREAKHNPKVLRVS